MTALHVWLHRLNRVALFVSLSLGVACAHLPREASPLDQRQTEPVSASAGGALNGIAWASSTAADFSLGQVVTGGDKCYGKNCKVTSLTATGDILLTGTTATGHVLQVGDAVQNVGGTVKVYANPANVNAIEFRIPGDSTLRGYFYPSTTTSAARTGALEVESYLRSVGVATGSLPACGATTAGGLFYDTTTLTVKRCNATAWHTVGEHPSFLSGYQPVVATGAAIVISGTRMTSAATLTRLGLNNTIAGTGGGNYTASVRNVTTATTLCTKTNACSSGPGMTSGACTGDFAVSDDVELRVDTSTCTTGPAFNIVAEFTSKD